MYSTDVPRAQDVSQIRFICMGRGLLQDRQTLSSARIPSFPTHPTPINVVVRSNVLAAKKGIQCVVYTS